MIQILLNSSIIVFTKFSFPANNDGIGQIIEVLYNAIAIKFQLYLFEFLHCEANGGLPTASVVEANHAH